MTKNTDNYQLITDRQELKAILEYFGIDDDDITGALVLVGDGDYDDVLLTEDRAPWRLLADFRPVSYYR